MPVGGGKIFAAEKVVVTQPTEGDFKAFSAVCTHQGCVVAKIERRGHRLHLPRQQVLDQGRLGGERSGHQGARGAEGHRRRRRDHVSLTPPPSSALTVSTGHGASSRMCWAVLPVISLPTGDAARSPITIRSASLVHGGAEDRLGGGLPVGRLQHLVLDPGLGRARRRSRRCPAALAKLGWE